MLVFGLTGNIGSGKSTVGRLLQEAGVPVIDADLVAREVVAPGMPALSEIAARFPGVVVDGVLDRKALGARVFQDPAELQALEEITHPRISAEVRRRLEALQAKGVPFAVYEAALIVERGLQCHQDGLIVVTIPPATQRSRVLARDGGSPVQVQARIDAQLPQEVKVREATWVIDNGGTVEELRAGVARLLTQLRSHAAARPGAARA